MNGRVYEPLTAQFLSPDPYIVFPDNWVSYNRYLYGMGNPFKYTDPTGEWVWIVVGAVVGGVINVVAHWDQIDNFGEGLATFGVGAAGGALMAATGGAAAGVFGAGVGAGGFVGGAVAAGVGYSYGTVATSIGNSAFFGDPMPTSGQFFTGLGVSMATGGVFNGAIAATNGRNFWTGKLNVPKPTLPDLSRLPKPELKQPHLNETIEKLKTPLKDLSGNAMPKNMYALDNQTPLMKMTGDGIPNPNWRDPNFRANLIKASGIDPGKAAQAHHIFPARYGNEFAKAGVDINRYGAWWETGSHLKNAYQYNQSWEIFFRETSNPTRMQIYQEALKLKSMYGY
jgi:hypothetical protein